MSQTITLTEGKWYLIEARLREIYGFPQDIKSRGKITERFYGEEICLRSDDTLTFTGNPDPDIKSKLVELATKL